MESQTMAMFDGKTAAAFDAIGNTRTFPLMTALLSEYGPGKDAFHMVRNFPSFPGFGMAAPRTNPKGTVGKKAHGHSIQPIWM